MESNLVGSLILGLLKVKAWGYYLLPAPLKTTVASMLGGILRAFKLRHRVVLENLRIAFPGEDADSAARRESLFRSAYFHLALLILEILMLLGPMRRYASKKVELRGLDHWKKAKTLGKGVVMLSSHVGNWEVMLAGGGVLGIDIMMVTKHLKPEWLHQAIEKGRLKCGVRATYEPRTFRDVLKHLKLNGTVGFVLDQYAGPPVGVRVPVFGVPVGTNTVVAMLARRTGAPVLPVVNYRTPEGGFVVEIFPPLELSFQGTAEEDQNRELAEATAKFASVLETHIVAQPEQWLCIHRRFKGDLSPLKPDEWSRGRSRGARNHVS